MKSKAGKIMAMMLAATMLFGTVPVGAEELEALDIENISADEDAFVPELSGDDYTNVEAVSDNGLETIYGAEADVADDTDMDEAAADRSDGSNKSNKIKKSSAEVFKKIRGGKNGKNKFMYNKLTKAEKKIYDKIDKEVKRLLYEGGATQKRKNDNTVKYTKEFYTEKFKTGGKQNERFEHVYDIYMVDNPQAFFLSEHRIASVKGKNTFFCVAKINADTQTAKKIKDRGDEIAKNLEADAKKVKQQKSDYKKLYKIHEIICTRLNDDGGDYFKGDIGGLHTTYYKKRRIADDYVYATTYVALARLCGFEAYHVYGDSNGHTTDWVKIKLGKKWYNIDPDKCDVPLEEGDYERGFNLKYFLKNDKDIDYDGIYKHVIVPEFKKYYPQTCKTSYKLPTK